MERNSFKEYSVNTHNIKRRAATDERLFGRFDANREWKQNQTHITSEYYYPQIYISREYSTDMANIGLGCLHVNIRRILAMELDMCKSNITGFASARGGFSSTRKCGSPTR